MKVLMHALAASCEELRATTGNPPLLALDWMNHKLTSILEMEFLQDILHIVSAH
jgi:hypothetical protein